MDDTSSALHVNLITVRCISHDLSQSLPVSFCIYERMENMPRNQFQRMVFAFLTVLITVHAYVFYSLYVVNRTTLMSINGTTSVISAISRQGGVYMLGRFLPIWAVVLVEFCLAYSLEALMEAPVPSGLQAKSLTRRRITPCCLKQRLSAQLWD